MKPDLAQLEAIVRNRICAVCSARDVAGNCGLDNPSDCAVFRFFPQIVKTVAQVHSENIAEYIRAIRQNICSICAEQDAETWCELRRQAQCALDAYVLPIVDAIEEATGQTLDRERFAAAITAPAPAIFTGNLS